MRFPLSDGIGCIQNSPLCPGGKTQAGGKYTALYLASGNRPSPHAAAMVAERLFGVMVMLHIAPCLKPR